MKLLIAPPQSDESITSVIDRGATLYGTTRDQLIGELGRSSDLRVNTVTSHLDLDVNPPSWLVGALADATSIDCVSLQKLRLPKSSWLLDVHNRDAVCELCLKEDIARFETIYFRRDWTLSFITHCSKHLVPLTYWTVPQKSYRPESRAAPTSITLARPGPMSRPSAPSPQLTTFQSFMSQPDTTDLKCIWERVVRLESEMRARLFRDPRAFEARSKPERQLLEFVCGNWGGHGWTAPMFSILPGAGLSREVLFARPPGLPPAFQRANDSWESFRRMGNPIYRRAGTWVLAQCFLRTLPLALGTSRRAHRSRNGPIVQSRNAWMSILVGLMPVSAREYAANVLTDWPRSKSATLRRVLQANRDCTPDAAYQQVLMEHFRMLGAPAGRQVSRNGGRKHDNQ